ncbi:MAG: BRCT domain-containing protein [Planctomycetota bacterium]
MKSELGVILMVIVFAILSLVFGVSAYFNMQEIEGNEVEGKAFATLIEKEKQTTRDLSEKIAEYEEKKQIYTEKIAKSQAQADYYRQLSTSLRKAHEKRLELQKSGKDFEQQVKAVSQTVSTVKQKTLAQIEAEITQLRNDMEKKVAEDGKKKDAVVEEVRLEKEKFQKAGKLHVDKMNYAKSQAGNTVQELRDLTTREVVHAKLRDRAVGKVVLSDVERNLVSIDLGTGDGVKNGFRFEVFAMAPGNKHVTKAYIEVTNAGEKQSHCLVIRRPIALPEDPLSSYIGSEPEEKFSPLIKSGKKDASAEVMTSSRIVMTGQNLNNPIAEGDLIQNPFFEAGGQRTFYIAGSKELVGGRQKSAIRYNRSEIKDMAERYGAKVLPAVDTSINYVIAQKIFSRNPPDDTEFEKAVDLGIPVIYEWELFRFLSNE